MPNLRSSGWRRALTVLAGLLILKVTLGVLLVYRDYLPPNFESEFLRGRHSYFFGPYQWAFYTHIASGPITLILGLILISERFRLRFPTWHRSLGKSQILLVVLLLAPSGLWMARYAESGAVAGAGFGTLAIVTATCALFGWRSAVKRKFSEHRRWMWRCFLCLCSAVVLRLIGGLSIVTDVGAGWSYPLAAWVSWLAPLGVFESSGVIRRQLRGFGIFEQGHSAPSGSALSPAAMEISARR
ncbi:MAG TPA: DUF2306 domain-containing protein [Pirellulales bacterium]|jgi:hypothetical protein|nr:DUF2306 domain-containing protein [Pirellulales bacterium]